HSIITLVLFLILVILYATVGFISQISNTFWDYLTDLGQKMSFSTPIQSLFYALSATVYFVLFLPFFVFQFPFWFSGWVTSKIGFKLFLILLITFTSSAILYYFNPNIAQESISRISQFHDSIKTEYFASDSLTTSQDELIELVEDTN
ncbi:MAG: hypothetical protein OQJ81_01275, partial [Melioribacteraceae bacterium]|nr:hypothetical protein [Melioribacteraceae bacterium]